MKALGELAGIALVAVLLTGCSLLHIKRHPPQGPPLQTGAGSIEQEQKRNEEPPPPSTLPQPSEQTAPPPSLPTTKPRKVKHPKKRRTPEAAPSPAPPVGDSSASRTPTSPIGPLSTGDAGTGDQTHHETLALITQTRQGLDEIKRALSAEEQDTAAQIRTFLQQAQQALDSGDADGAHTLATKAKLLLDELTKR